MRKLKAGIKMRFRPTASRNWVGLVLLIITFTCLKERASPQPGFLSLDCGAPGPYVDNKGISWVPDDAYMFSGRQPQSTSQPCERFIRISTISRMSATSLMSQEAGFATPFPSQQPSGRV